MNGAHDVGGMHGLGRVERETDEPVFHGAWEGKVFAMGYIVERAAGLYTTDETRFARENVTPLRYFTASYYERALDGITQNLVNRGVITEEELNARMQQFKRDPDSRPPRTENSELVAQVEQTIRRGRRSTQRTVASQARFQAGDHGATRNMHPRGHTRLPRYARGKRGVIERLRGAFVYPDTNAHRLGENPQPVYSVRFDGRELWGDEVEPNTVVYLDMWESYLEPSPAVAGEGRVRVPTQRGAR